MFFKKKDSHINIYEAHADEQLYDLWAKRDKLTAMRTALLRLSFLMNTGDGLQKSGYKKSFALTASFLVALNFSTAKPLILTTMALLMKQYELLLLMVWRKKRMTRLLMKNGRNGMKKTN